MTKKVIETKQIYQNHWLCVKEEVVAVNDVLAPYTVVNVRPGTTVLALNEAGEGFLVREYKHAVGRVSLELVSGGLEDGEAPLKSAQRELREEAGLVAQKWIELGTIDPFTTIVNSPNYLYLALGVRTVPQSLDALETLDVERVPLREILELEAKGEITHAPSCLTILKGVASLRERKCTRLLEAAGVPLHSH